MSDRFAMSIYEIVSAFDREIPDDKRGDFYRWLDDAKDQSFSKACSKFYLDRIQSGGNLAMQKFAFMEFYNTLLQYVPEYRKEKKLDETKIFIDSLTK